MKKTVPKGTENISKSSTSLLHATPPRAPSPSIMLNRCGLGRQRHQVKQSERNVFANAVNDCNYVLSQKNSRIKKMLLKIKKE